MLFGRFDVTERSRVLLRLPDRPAALHRVDARRLRASRSGRVFIAQRDNVRAAQALGVNSARTKLAAFALSGAIAAVAGALFGYQVGAVDPTTFPVQRSIDVFVFAIVGGIASPYGAVLRRRVLPVARYFGTSIFGFLDHIGSDSLRQRDRRARPVRRRTDRPGVLPGWHRRDRHRVPRPLPATRRDAARHRAAEPARRPRRSRRDVAEAHRLRTSTSPADDALLVCRGLDVGYDGVQVLFGVDMHVRQRRGARAARHQRRRQVDAAAGGQRPDQPSAGTITFDGRDITKLNPVDRARARHRAGARRQGHLPDGHRRRPLPGCAMDRATKAHVGARRRRAGAGARVVPAPAQPVGHPRRQPLRRRGAAARRRHGVHHPAEAADHRRAVARPRADDRRAAARRRPRGQRHRHDGRCWSSSR